MKVKNHSSESVSIPFIKLALQYGNLKKIKLKDAKGWESVEEKNLASAFSIEAGEEKEFPWDFKLSEVCRISDKDGSLYLTFSDKEEAWPAGNIQLLIEPKIVIKHFLEIFDNFVRFKIGAMKYSKGMVEVKLTPPGSREYGNIDSLVLRLGEADNSLNLEYVFNTRSIDVSSMAMTTKKQTKEFKQSLSLKKFYIYGNSPDQDFIISSIHSILNEVKAKNLI